jgi:tRNA nucleotidyltransferase (CCA-adding enzyme)
MNLAAAAAPPAAMQPAPLTGSAAAPKLRLTEAEQQLFTLLLNVVKEEKLDTTLRVAGGWVRDKLLGITPTAINADGCCNKMDVDIALDNCLGVAFAEIVNK